MDYICCIDKEIGVSTSEAACPEPQSLCQMVKFNPNISSYLPVSPQLGAGLTKIKNTTPGIQFSAFAQTLPGLLTTANGPSTELRATWNALKAHPIQVRTDASMAGEKPADLGGVAQACAC